MKVPAFNQNRIVPQIVVNDIAGGRSLFLQVRYLQAAGMHRALLRMPFHPVLQPLPDFFKIPGAVKIHFHAVHGAGHKMDMAVGETRKHQVSLQINGLLRIPDIGRFPTAVPRILNHAIFDPDPRVMLFSSKAKKIPIIQKQRPAMGRACAERHFSRMCRSLEHTRSPPFAWAYYI